MESKDRVVRSGRFTVRKMAMNKEREAKNDSKLCKETKPSTETTGDERAVSYTHLTLPTRSTV